MEGEKTQLLIAIETQKVVEMEAETDKLKATIIANKQREVSELNMKKKIMEKEAEQNSQFDPKIHELGKAGYGFQMKRDIEATEEELSGKNLPFKLEKDK